MDMIDRLNPVMRPLPVFVALLLIAAGFVAQMPRAEADTCRFTTCGGRERMLGTKPLYRDPGGRGNRTWNDIYKERNRQQPAITAKPLDLGSPATRRKPGDLGLDHPNVNNEHRRWCRQHYRSYDGISDRYTTFDGRSLYCDSPYD